MLPDEPSPPPSRNELSGTVIGPSVQSGTIRDVHFHGAPAPELPAPRQLPPVPTHFAGRLDELALLDGLLDPDAPPVAVLTGTGGVGKTALALVWAHRVRDRYPGGQLYTDLGGFLRAFGIAPKDIPVTLAERVAMYRSCTAERSLLVLLDDVLSPAQARVLRPASAASRVLVTSRGRLDGLVAEGAQLIGVGPLDTADSVAVLTRTLGAARIAGHERSAQALAQLCGGLPVALRVTAGRLATRPRVSLARMVDELTDEDTRLSRLSIVDAVSVPLVFEVSYRSLDPTAAQLYRRLALHPGPDFGLGPVAAVLAGGAEPDEVVDELVAASLLQEIDEGRFRFHDLLRLHAKRMVSMDETVPERDAARLAILEWYWAAASRADRIVTPYRRRLPYRPVSPAEHQPALADRAAALAWLERERVNLVMAGRCALEYGRYELAWQLSDVVWPLLLIGRHHRDRMEVDRRGVAAAQAWGHSWAEADMRKRLGQACTTAGEFVEAEGHLTKAVELYREADDARGVVDAQEGLAALYRDSGREDAAVELFRQTLAANQELGDDRCVGLTLISLGRLLLSRGRPEEALGLLREATDIFDRLAEVDPYNRVRVTIAVAGAYLGIGDLSRAEAAATGAAARMGELGSAYERAQALDLLGQIARRRGDPGGARRHFHAALDIFTALGSARAGQLRRQLIDLDAG